MGLYTPAVSDAPDYLDPYRRAIARHGPGFDATLWSSRDGQLARFDVIADLAGLESTTIVDAGCGHGDFAARLIERGVPFARYVGIDAMEPMIDAAERRRLDPDRVRFIAADLLWHPETIARHEPDWVCFSGTLNTMDETTARGLVDAAFEAAVIGVAFNFLSDRHHARWAGRDLAPARRFDTVAWLDWALHRTSRVSFTQDYLDGHDATIVMRRDD